MNSTQDEASRTICGAKAAIISKSNMPTTDIYFPILSRFFCRVEKSTGEPVMPVDTEKKQEREWDPSKLPKGVVLGPDGKP